MLDLRSDCFNDICADPAVREELAGLDDKRQAAIRRFWIVIAAGAALTLAVYVALDRAHEGGFTLAIAMFLVIGTAVLAMNGLSKVGEALKRPVLTAIAAKAGLDYMETGFSPPVYPEAERALFGRWLSEQVFTDLFHGKDEQGRNFGFYEARLVRGSGKNRHTIFRGQVYAVERNAPADGTTVIVPDRGLFNFFEPHGGMARVKLDSDADFERKFEVYSTSEMAARQLLFDSAFRARLVTLSADGHVFVFVGPDNALVAASGPDRFEPGSLLRNVKGEDRVRAMLDDVCASVALMRELKAKLG